MLEWIIWGIGAIIAYIPLRKEARYLETNYNWNTVFLNMFLSLFSWMVVVMAVCVYVYGYMSDTFDKKPPKWL